MNRWRLSVASLFLALLAGCASLTGSRNQAVLVTAFDADGVEVLGAECKLSNDAGEWYTATPRTVMVGRSNADLLVVCEKDGLPGGQATVVSSAMGMMFGNILFGGVIGVAVDHAQGSGYDYPSAIRITMGRHITLRGEAIRSETTTSDPQSLSHAQEAP